MDIEKRRILYLFYLLTQQSGYVRSGQLALQMGLSGRTIKSDIGELRKFAAESGAELLSKRGTGYLLKVVDEERYQAVKLQMELHFQAVGDDEQLILHRVGEILRHILTEESYLTVDDIADEMYLTKSAIRREMKIVNRYLDNFRLCGRKKNESGPFLKGEELDWRMLMLCVYENCYHEAVPRLANENYLRWFFREDEERYQIRYTLLHRLRCSSGHVRDGRTQVLARYLCLMANRAAVGCQVNFNEEKRGRILCLPQLSTARGILEDLEENHGIVTGEGELLALTLLLACWADIPCGSDLASLYPEQYPELEQAVTRFCGLVWRSFGIDLPRFPESREYLEAALLPALLQKDFGALFYDMRLVHAEDERIGNYPLATQLAHLAAVLWREDYGCSMSGDNILMLATHLQALFLNISYHVKPPRVIVTTFGGLTESRTLGRLIQNRFGSGLACIDSYELYELREVDESAYDWVIYSYSDIFYRYNWPHVTVHPIPTQDQMNEIYNRIVLSGVRLEEAWERLGFSGVHMHRKFRYQNLDSFVQLIGFRVGKDAESISRIEEYLHSLSRVSVFGKMGFFLIPRGLVRESFFDIYELAREKKIGMSPVCHIIVCSASFEDTPESVRFISDLLYMLFHNTDSIASVLRTEDPAELISIVRNSLKSLPISLI